MEIVTSDHIQGVKYARLNCFADERGSFSEIFRREWFPDRTWGAVQLNRSISKRNVLRGLHYHFHQIDYWYVLAGELRIALVDLRATSQTFLQTEVIDLNAQSNTGIFIPPGVAHGYLAVTDGALMYVVDQYFNAKDELGVRWDDPSVSIDWGITSPILSPRDQGNPYWEDVAAEWRPE